MQIFLTGGTGYIGLELARVLAAAGHDLRALVRPSSDRAALDELGVACFVGDVTDRYSMREGMSGADWVVHAAADLDFGGPVERMHAVNVGGCENVASLAFKLGVGRLLAVSSVAVFGGSPPDGTASTEESPPLEPLPSHYGRTKRAGDDAIAVWAGRGLRVTTVYPSLVYGPPAKKQGSNSVLRKIARGQMPARLAADRRTSWIHVADLVEAMKRILEAGVDGVQEVGGRLQEQVAVPSLAPGREPRPRVEDRFVLAGDVITLGELIDRVARLAGVDPPRWSLPIGVARVAGMVTAPYFRARARRSPFMPDYLASLARDWHFDDTKARAALDWRPRSLEEGLPATVEFLKRSPR